MAFPGGAADTFALTFPANERWYRVESLFVPINVDGADANLVPLLILADRAGLTIARYASPMPLAAGATVRVTWQAGLTTSPANLVDINSTSELTLNLPAEFMVPPGFDLILRADNGDAASSFGNAALTFEQY